MIELLSDQDGQKPAIGYQYKIISHQESRGCVPTPQTTKSGATLAQESLHKLAEAIKNVEIKPKKD
jgi:hypothetical protein